MSRYWADWSMPLGALALGCALAGRALAEPATAATVGAPSGALAPPSLRVVAAASASRSQPGPEVAWSFRSAAPVAAAPALLPGGGVVVTTVEGYVHRLGADGGFEWSYALRGNPIGGAATDGDARVYVATSADRVYALEPNGHERWIHESPVTPVTPVLWGPAGIVYFVAADRRLYALSARTGALLWQRPLEHPVTGELALTPRGLVALGTRAPEVWLIGDALRAERVKLSGDLAQPPLFGDGQWYAQTGNELVAFERETQAVRWRCTGQHAALGAGGGALVLEQAGSLVWLATDSGRALHRLALPVAASAPAALTEAGVALVPTASGVLFLLAPEPEQVVAVRVSWAPLRTPVYDPVSRRAVVTGGDGVVTAVDIGRWLDRRDGA
jgi:outer membrane protein assembly factor BamB